MTVWEHLVANSTLIESAGDAWDHLVNPAGTGGGGDIYITVGVISLSEKDSIMIDEKQPNSLSEVAINSISEVGIDTINEVDINSLDGSC